MAKKNRREGRCVYCGTEGVLTRDHVPAKSIYRAPIPDRAPVVWACTDCNGGSSGDDQYFRDTIVKDIHVAETPQAQHALEAMLRGMQRPESRAYTEMQMKALGTAEMTSAAGLYLGTAATTGIDQRRLQSVTSRYVRGLHFLEYGEAEVEPDRVVVLIAPYKVRSDWQIWNGFVANVEAKVVQDSVFWYKTSAVPDAENSSYFLLVFFDEFPVIGHVKPRSATHAS